MSIQVLQCAAGLYVCTGCIRAEALRFNPGRAVVCRRRFALHCKDMAKELPPSLRPALSHPTLSHPCPTSRSALPMLPCQTLSCPNLSCPALVHQHLGNLWDWADPQGLTPLQVAAQASHPELVGILLSHGADVSAQDSQAISLSLMHAFNTC